MPSENGTGGQDLSRAVGVQIASHITVIAAVFCLVVATLMLVNYYRMKGTDPLLSPRSEELDRLAAEHLADPRNEQLKKNMMALDQTIRQDYCDRRAFHDVGVYFLIGGLVLLVVSLNRAVLFRAAPGTGLPAANRTARAALAVGAAVCSLALLIFVSLYPVGVPVDSSGILQGYVVPGPPSRQEWEGNWGAFRGPYNSGTFADGGLPRTWNEAEGTNIRWKIGVPLGGLSSPVVWNGKVYLSGATREKRELYCFDGPTGVMLWVGTYRSDPRAAADYQTWDEFEGLMHAVPTPVVDGRYVAAYYNNGEVACFDAETGRFLWSRLLGNTAENFYGISNSLLIHGDTLVAVFEGGQSLLYGLDIRTGRQLWKSERDGVTWASPILMPTPDSAPVVVISSVPYIGGWDIATGKGLWRVDAFGGEIASSPIIAGGKILACFEGYGMYAVTPGGQGDVTETHVAWKVEDLQSAMFPAVSSPVATSEFCYICSGEYLICLDVQTGEVIYEREMEDTVGYTSPVIAGDRLYVFGEEKTFVIRVGRKFELLGTGVLDESFSTCPAFSERSIFIRTEEHLYCISGAGQ